MDIWVDDCKQAPESCAVAKTYDDALKMCRKYKYDTLWLDFDLGEARTGLDLLRQLKKEGFCPPNVVCISWNIIGRKQIEDELRAHDT